MAEVAELVGEEGWGRVTVHTPQPANTTKYYAYLHYLLQRSSFTISAHRTPRGGGGEGEGDLRPGG